jgi:Cys-tRNA(Pro)/Cys-tRNA(Cys) deacylase
MTPAIDIARKHNIEHRVRDYGHDPESESYGAEAVRKLGLPADRVFKTLVVSLNSGQLAVGVLPVSSMLSLKRVAAAMGAKKAVMADRAEAERATGYVPGGISPLGQKKRLPTVIDASALDFATIHVSAGRRGLEIELDPLDLGKLTNAVFAGIAQ